MVNFAGVFGVLRPFRVLVLGDFLLDAYTTGRVKRISPEAPVPVLEAIKYEERPGGAGNVALNLRALSGVVRVVGRVGDDPEGRSLQRLLDQAGVDTTSLLQEKGYQTPIKNRMIAESQQLLRVDREKISPLDARYEELFMEKLAHLIPQVEIIALSDYGKGFLTDRLIRFVLETAKQHKVITIVDPKGIHFAKYKGATLLKPNLSEAYAAAKLSSSSSLNEVAEQILMEAPVDFLLITRSEAGMSLFSEKEGPRDFPVLSKEVKDVTGAGDTVMATLCFGMANGFSLDRSIQLANLAAGIAVEKIGCAQIGVADLVRRALQYDPKTIEPKEVRLMEEKKVLAADQAQELLESLLHQGTGLSHKTQPIVPA